MGKDKPECPHLVQDGGSVVQLGFLINGDLSAKQNYEEQTIHVFGVTSI